MPPIGPFHPQIVHFVVVPLVLGLPLYVLGLLVKRPRYLWPMASILLLVGTVAAWLAVQSGTEAHELAEQIPGVGEAVRVHEQLGHETKHIFTGILIVELLAIGTAWGMGQLGGERRTDGDGPAEEKSRSPMRHVPLGLRVVVAGSWIWGAWVVYDTADHGGDLVYSYAGGVGVRTGDPQDVQHLLMAGLYNQSRLDRKNGDSQGAADLVDVMRAQFPNDPDVKMLKVESLIVDRKDGRGALDLLATMTGDSDPRTQARRYLYESDAYALLSMPDSARAALQKLPARYQQSRMVKDRLAKLGTGGT
jgi:uncharacterized membrane protein